MINITENFQYNKTITNGCFGQNIQRYKNKIRTQQNVE